MIGQKGKPARREGAAAQQKAKAGKAAEDRQARLAAALRENLRRRKKGKLDGKPG